jgi:hypothetical protein
VNQGEERREWEANITREEKRKEMQVSHRQREERKKVRNQQSVKRRREDGYEGKERRMEEQNPPESIADASDFDLFFAAQSIFQKERRGSRRTRSE